MDETPTNNELILEKALVGAYWFLTIAGFGIQTLPITSTSVGNFAPILNNPGNMHLLIDVMEGLRIASGFTAGVVGMIRLGKYPTREQVFSSTSIATLGTVASVMIIEMPKI